MNDARVYMRNLKDAVNYSKVNRYNALWSFRNISPDEKIFTYSVCRELKVFTRSLMTSKSMRIKSA
jgi:hypothetical protein